MGKQDINLPKTAFSMKANLPNKEPGIIKVRIGPAIWGDNPKSVTKDVKDWIQSSFDKIH